MIGSKTNANVPVDPEERSSRIWFWCVMAALAFFCTLGIVSAVTGFPMNTVTAEETEDGVTETIEVGEDGQVTTEDGATVTIDSEDEPAASADEGASKGDATAEDTEADAGTETETTTEDGNQG